jgi:hypothetical protein
MEEWEFELEFLTYDAYDKAISGQGSVEEFEVDKTEFEEQLKNDFGPLPSDEDDWELIEDAE